MARDRPCSVGRDGPKTPTPWGFSPIETTSPGEYYFAKSRKHPGNYEKKKLINRPPFFYPPKEGGKGEGGLISPSNTSGGEFNLLKTTQEVTKALRRTIETYDLKH